MLATRTYQAERPLADASLLRRCERARLRAIALGYLTANDTEPKTVVQGETHRVALAKCEKWEAWVKAAEIVRLANQPDGDPNTETSSSPQPNRGPRYVISPHARPSQCASCKARIFWVMSENNKSVPVDPTGFSHFTSCPNASSHSKTSKPPKAPAQDRSNLPKHIRHLWAVAAANGLASSDATRTERIANSNKVLLHHGHKQVRSWNELGEEAARCLAGAIDAKVLKWGQVPGTTQGDEAA